MGRPKKTGYEVTADPTPISRVEMRWISIGGFWPESMDATDEDGFPWFVPEGTIKTPYKGEAEGDRSFTDILNWLSENGYKSEVSFRTDEGSTIWVVSREVE